MFNPFNSLESYNALRRAAGLDGSRSPSPDPAPYRAASPSPASSPVRSPSPAPSTSSEDEGSRYNAYPSDPNRYDPFRYEPMANLPRPASPPSWQQSYPSYGGASNYPPSYDASSSYHPSQPIYGYPGHDHNANNYSSYNIASLSAHYGFRPTAGATLELCFPDNDDTAGCAVAAMATVAGTDYATARYHAIESGDFQPDAGMRYSGMSRTLRAMGIDNSIETADDWSELPDLAIVTARDNSIWMPEGVGHAVVYERNASGQFIYDMNQPTPVPLNSNYSLMEKYHLKIDR